MFRITVSTTHSAMACAHSTITHLVEKRLDAPKQGYQWLEEPLTCMTNLSTLDISYAKNFPDTFFSRLPEMKGLQAMNMLGFDGLMGFDDANREALLHGLAGNKSLLHISGIPECHESGRMID
jgi:hypothetical protein